MFIPDLRNAAVTVSMLTVLIFAFQLSASFVLGTENEAAVVAFVIFGFLASLYGPVALRTENLTYFSIYTVFTVLYWIGDLILSILLVYNQRIKLEEEANAECLNSRPDDFDFCLDFSIEIVTYQVGFSVAYLVLKFLFLLIIVANNIILQVKGFPVEESFREIAAEQEVLPAYTKEESCPPLYIEPSTPESPGQERRLSSMLEISRVPREFSARQSEINELDESDKVEPFSISNQHITMDIPPKSASSDESSNPKEFGSVPLPPTELYIGDAVLRRAHSDVNESSRLNIPQTNVEINTQTHLSNLQANQIQLPTKEAKETSGNGQGAEKEG